MSVHCPFPGTPSTVPGLEKGHSSWKPSRAALAGKHTGRLPVPSPPLDDTSQPLLVISPHLPAAAPGGSTGPKLGWEWESAVPSGEVSSFLRGRHREVAPPAPLPGMSGGDSCSLLGPRGQPCDEASVRVLEGGAGKNQCPRQDDCAMNGGSHLASCCSAGFHRITHIHSKTVQVKTLVLVTESS